MSEASTGVVPSEKVLLKFWDISQKNTVLDSLFNKVASL